MNLWSVLAVIAAVLAFLGAILGMGSANATQVLAIGSITLAVIGQSAPAARG